MLDLQNKWPFGLSHSSRWRVVGAVAIVFALLLSIDSPVTAFVRMLPAQAIAPFHIITRLGNSDWVLIPGLLITLGAGLLALVPQLAFARMALRRWSVVASFYFVAVAGAGLFATLVKRLVGRARPVHFEQLGIWHFQPNFGAWDFQSFPSGDTTTIFAFATVTALLWPRLTWPAYTLAALVGLSRIMVGMHYPSDVFGGMIVGTVGAIAVRNFYANREWLFAKTQAGRVTRKPMPL